MNNIEKVKLPSNGALVNVPSEVAIRGMKGREISTLFSSFTDAAVDEIIKGVTDPSIASEDLCDEDKRYILHKARELTFGSTLEQQLKCPFCGKVHTYTKDYSELEFSLLNTEEFLEPIKMPDGKVITRALPTKATWDTVYRYKEKRNLPESMSFLLIQASKINTIDGKRVSLGEILDYLDNLPGKDLVELSKQLTLNFGLNTMFKVECQSCHSEFPGGIGINADLFR